METAVKGAAKPSKPAMPDNEDSDLKLDMEISAEDVGSGGDKPEPLEGWLDKKGSHHVHLSGGEWQKRYCRVDEASASLLYYKSTGTKEKPQGSIDLRTVNEIGSYDKSAKGGKADPTRISIDAGEKVYKFRGATAEEGQKWVEGLNAWKDYFLLNMAT